MLNTKLGCWQQSLGSREGDWCGVWKRWCMRNERSLWQKRSVQWVYWSYLSNSSSPKLLWCSRLTRVALWCSRDVYSDSGFGVVKNRLKTDCVVQTTLVCVGGISFESHIFQATTLEVQGKSLLLPEILPLKWLYCFCELVSSVFKSKHSVLTWPWSCFAICYSEDQGRTLRKRMRIMQFTGR